MTDKPTDEALENLFVEETGFDPDDFPAAIFGFTRAALTKWGQPAQEAEPVAYLTRNAEGDPAMLFFDKDEASTYCEDGVDPEPLFTAPQPVAREPLSHAQAKALVLKYGNDPLNLVFQVELAHGIKGGQHGTE